MPAGLPPSGLDRRFLLADRILRNTGSDVTVNYQVAARRASNGDIFVGGNNDYVGLMTEGLYGELVQGANLPASSNTLISAAVNLSGGGWLVMDGAASVFKNNSNGLTAAWSDITPPAVVARDDLLEYNGALLTFTASVNGPDRDIEFSLDDGATWDSDPGDFTGINLNLQRAVTNPAQNVILVSAASGTNVAFTKDQGSPPYTWSLLPVAFLGIPTTDQAVNDAGTKGVVCAGNGQIWTTDDFTAANSRMIPNGENPFVSTAVGTNIAACVYVSGLSGFFLYSNTGPTCAFIPEADMTQVIPGNYLGGSVTTQNNSAVSDGFQAIMVASNNEAVVSLRNIGQLSRG